MIRRLDCRKHKPRQLKSNKEGRNFLSPHTACTRNSPSVISTSVEIPKKQKPNLFLVKALALTPLFRNTLCFPLSPLPFSSSCSLLSVNSRDARGERGGGRRMTNESLAGFGGELYHGGGGKGRKRWRRRRRKWALKSRRSFPAKENGEKRIWRI